MVKHLKLKNPIKGFDGSQVTELAYDVEAIEMSAFDKIAGETEPGIQQNLRLGRAAILACNPTMNDEDLRHIRGVDIFSVTKVGADFITAWADLMRDSSGDAPETSPEPSTRP